MYRETINLSCGDGNFGKVCSACGQHAFQFTMKNEQAYVSLYV